MCGICGVIGGDPARELERVRAMTDALAHRGPDAEGFHADEGAVLGHRRLAIIDPDAPTQPLGGGGGRYWIDFNGEIYNYRELRGELEADGHAFSTATDTEVLLRLYEVHGADCVHRLRGMFAFVVWDASERTLFAARDRFGQKPFYYAIAGERLLFASEIKALLAHGDVRPEPDPAAIDYYLSLRFIPPPLTMLKGVRKLPAAHRLFWRAGELRTERYWSLDFATEEGRSDASWIEELEARLDDAVRSHMVSDVPVGAFLSGGLDSGAVVAAMSRHAEGPLRTFCVGSQEPSFDERAHARAVADLYGAVHREAVVGPELIEDVDTLVRALDEPSDPIAACLYEASRLAARDVKVVLTGDGGDEVFAGFDRYAAFDLVGAYAALPGWLRHGLLRPLIRSIPQEFGYKSLTQRARWLDAVALEDPGRRYARMTSFFRFGADEKDWVYGPALADALRGADAAEAIAEPFRSAAAGDTLHRMIAADLATRLPEHTLMLADRMSMAHGLEARAPLLDHLLAEFTARMPARLKARRGKTKIALRDAVRDRLPAGIVSRPKQGFMFPVAFWMDEHRLRAIRDALVGGPLVDAGWIRGDAIDRLAGEHLAAREDHHVRLWMLLNLQAWYEIFVNDEPAAAPRPPFARVNA
jgi:asparagine synthase (glutamine-hydrolysing)